MWTKGNATDGKDRIFAVVDDTGVVAGPLIKVASALNAGVGPPAWQILLAALLTTGTAFLMVWAGAARSSGPGCCARRVRIGPREAAMEPGA